MERPPAGPALQPEVQAARRLATLLALLFLAVGVLLLALAAAGRGVPYLLGALDFLVIGGVLYWVGRGGRGVRAR